jgi:hypothetical protein
LFRPGRARTCGSRIPPSRFPGRRPGLICGCPLRGGRKKRNTKTGASGWCSVNLRSTDGPAGPHQPRRSKMKSEIWKRITSRRKSKIQSAGLPFSWSRVEFLLINPMSIRAMLWRRSLPGRICSGVTLALATRTSRPAAHSRARAEPKW